MSDYLNPPTAILEPSAGRAAGDRVPCHLFMPEVPWPRPVGPVIRMRSRRRERWLTERPVVATRPAPQGDGPLVAPPYRWADMEPVEPAVIRWAWPICTTGLWLLLAVLVGVLK